MDKRAGEKRNVAIGLLGTTLDTGTQETRWERWRPSVALCRQGDLLIHRFEILHQQKVADLAATVEGAIRSVSPETEVTLRTIPDLDPWDFEQVFGALHDFARAYPFDTDREEYLVHITTGSHVAQICMFLLTESRHFPARLLQTIPPRRGSPEAGTFQIIDLDLSRYDRIATRFFEEAREG